ncbi:hypothetical protein [Filimonas effusa]|uniref:Uncharacterized protein n=1 Tax=Filimonas effusa TaxID=2508721 RepID=A0A4Q1D5I9_9BACT|nr:hypothetical protein [Filimonas effusa]RXK82921.1 hypothetical protein ESB13_12395 [Filimonas effusa]
MDSAELAAFLFQQIEETIGFKQYVSTVNISYDHGNTYGNEYIQVIYRVTGNDQFEQLPFNERNSMFQMASTYVFTLATNRKRFEEKEKLWRIIAFRYIYESLMSYAALKLEKHLDPESVVIKIKGIDLWPMSNYAEKFFLTDTTDRYSNAMLSDFDIDIVQWNKLHELANNSKKIYDKEKKRFTITAAEITSISYLNSNSVYATLLRYNVPIKIKGVKTIDATYIHTLKLTEALKKEMNAGDWAICRPSVCERILTYLYDHYLLSEKESIINHQQSEYLKNFAVQEGDIVQLQDKRIVVVCSVFFDSNHSANLKYVNLKTNLETGERTRVIEIGKALYHLKRKDFLDFMSSIAVKHLSILDKWMAKRKTKLMFSPFEPDLVKGLPH